MRPPRFVEEQFSHHVSALFSPRFFLLCFCGRDRRDRTGSPRAGAGAEKLEFIGDGHARADETRFDDPRRQVEAA